MEKVQELLPGDRITFKGETVETVVQSVTEHEVFLDRLSSGSTTYCRNLRFVQNNLLSHVRLPYWRPKELAVGDTLVCDIPGMGLMDVALRVNRRAGANWYCREIGSEREWRAEAEWWIAMCTSYTPAKPVQMEAEALPPRDPYEDLHPINKMRARLRFLFTNNARRDTIAYINAAHAMEKSLCALALATGADTPPLKGLPWPSRAEPFENDMRGILAWLGDSSRRGELIPLKEICQLTFDVQSLYDAGADMNIRTGPHAPVEPRQIAADLQIED